MDFHPKKLVAEQKKVVQYLKEYFIKMEQHQRKRLGERVSE